MHLRPSGVYSESELEHPYILSELVDAGSLLFYGYSSFENALMHIIEDLSFDTERTGAHFPVVSRMVTIYERREDGLNPVFNLMAVSCSRTGPFEDQEMDHQMRCVE